MRLLVKKLWLSGLNKNKKSNKIKFLDKNFFKSSKKFPLKGKMYFKAKKTNKNLKLNRILLIYTKNKILDSLINLLSKINKYNNNNSNSSSNNRCFSKKILLVDNHIRPNRGRINKTNNSKEIAIEDLLVKISNSSL